MQQFNLAEAKSHFSQLVKIAIRGEDVVIARGNKPLLWLVPITPNGRIRKPGTAKGPIRPVVPDFYELPAVGRKAESRFAHFCGVWTDEDAVEFDNANDIGPLTTERSL